MKIIISRKGFDSSNGGVPSPIFEGRMLSLPIPVDEKNSNTKYSHISWSNYNVGAIVTDLTNGKISSDHNAHLDPDLNKKSIPRDPGWRPIFGQAEAAQGHLNNQKVDKGDIFLFFGLFREVKNSSGRFEFKKEECPKHVIWGWMQIDEKITVADGTDKIEKWAEYHPHLKNKNWKNNTVYIGKNDLELPGKKVKGIKGAGVFERFHPALQLTRKDHQVTSWKLPLWFYEKKALTYHPKTSKDRWRKSDDGSSTLLKSASRGQEFVLDTDIYPEAIDWVQKIIENANHAKS